LSEDLAFFKLDPLRVCESRHLCSPLRLASEAPDMSRASRTSLWAEGNSGTSELDLQQSLACSDEALSLLAQESEPPALVMREIGGSGGIDVAAFFGKTGKLLLVDCKNSKPATPKSMRDQRVQANRLALSTLSNITPLPPVVTVVLLAGWSAFSEDRAFEHLGGWGSSRSPRDLARIPSAERWGVIPFALEGDQQQWCVIGRWDAISSCGLSELSRISLSHRPYGRVEPFADGLLLREDAPSLFTLRVPAATYAAATGASSASSPVRLLLDSAYAGNLDMPGVTFLGETNEKGNVRMCFAGESADAWDNLVRVIRVALTQRPV